MSKHHQAGAIAQSARLDALEKAQTETTKRLDALLMIVEKQSEQLNKLVDTPEVTYTAQFDRWPGTHGSPK
jgi:hypothetical protein